MGELAASEKRKATLGSQAELVLDLPLEDCDEKFWSVMDRTTIGLTESIIESFHASAEFLSSDGWSADVPDNLRKVGLVHPAGCLHMGESALDSVTDFKGTFHSVTNLHATGGALFPSCGSWNPTLTGVALALHLADNLAIGDSK